MTGRIFSVNISQKTQQLLDFHTIVSPSFPSYKRTSFCVSFRKYHIKNFWFYRHHSFTEGQTFKSQDTNKNLLENLLYPNGIICQESYLVNMKGQNDKGLVF